MSIVKAALVRAALLGTGFALGIGSVATLAAAPGTIRAYARETITVAVGDTIQPRFSIRTDSVLAVVGTKIVARHCGQSAIYYRSWRGLTTALSADTVTVNVPCVADPNKTASVELFNRFGRDSTGLVVGRWVDSMTVGQTFCVYVVTKNSAGKILTGKRPTLSSSDTLIAKFGADSVQTTGPGIPLGACPDTTINPTDLWRGQMAPPMLLRKA